jgi:hypothetical protein
LSISFFVLTKKIVKMPLLYHFSTKKNYQSHLCTRILLEITLHYVLVL